MGAELQTRMGTDGAYLLGHGASLPGWHWFCMVCRIDLGHIKGFSPRLNAIGLVIVAYVTEHPFKVPNVFLHSTVWSSFSFTWYKSAFSLTG